jgi:hypothetical protein
MDKFKVQHVIISYKPDGTVRLMSLHLPIDGKIRIHTIFPNNEMFNDVLYKIQHNEPIILEAELVQLECPTYYALISAEKR